MLRGEEALSSSTSADTAFLDSTLPDSRRVELAVSEIREATISAKRAAPQERAAAWLAVERLTEVAEESLADTPRYCLIEIQRGVAYTERAKQSLSAPTRPDQQKETIESGREALRHSLAAFSDAEETLQEQLRDPPRRGLLELGEYFKREQLTALQEQVFLQMAIAYRWQALSYEAKSNDRVNSISQALEKLQQVPRENEADYSWLATQEEITCLRLAGRYQKAQEAIGKAWGRKRTDEHKFQLQTQRLLLLAAKGDTKSLLSVAAATKSIQLKQQTAELLSVLNERKHAGEIYAELVEGFSRKDSTGKKFEIASAAAANARELGDNQQAIDYYRSAAISDREHPQAAATHLQAVRLAREHWLDAKKQQQDVGGALSQYHHLMRQQINSWRRDVETSIIYFWQAEINLEREFWLGAAAVLKSVPRESSLYREAMEKILWCYQQEFDRLGQAGDEKKQRHLLESATRELMRRVGHDATMWTPDDKRIAMQVASWQVEYGVERSQQYVERDLLQRLQKGDPERAKELGRMTAAEAEQLASEGKLEKALAAYRQLMLADPMDGSLQEAYAELQAKRRTSEGRRNALRQWRQIEARTELNSPRWRRAREARIDLLEILGEQGRANKLRKLTVLLYPAAAVADGK